MGKKCGFSSLIKSCLLSKVIIGQSCLKTRFSQQKQQLKNLAGYRFGAQKTFCDVTAPGQRYLSSLAIYGVHLRTKITENKIQFEVQKLDYPC